MPSAASAKLEKQASGNQTESSSDNNNSSNNNNTPIRQALVIIEHKIRNLEKRKTKLESYRTIQLSGKELSPDQKAAVSKYDEVAQSLEFARELSKQMLQLATTAEKEQKRQARREIALRAQAETAKIREVLTIQNILTCFSSNVQIREDFLNGTNGAVKLEEDDLKLLEKFHADIQVKRQAAPEDVPFSTVAQKAAEYLSLTIDGRPKQYNETTFDNVRRILTSIQESGYLDKYGKTSENDDDDVAGDNGNESPAANDELVNDQSVLEDGISKVSKLDIFIPIHDNVERDVSDVGNLNISQQLQTLQQQSQSMPPPSVSVIPQAIDVPQFSTEAPSAAAVPAPSFPQQPQQQQSSQPTSIVSTQIPTQPPPSQMPIPVVPTQIASVAQAAQVASGPSTVVQPSPAAAANPLHFPPTTVRAVEQAYFKQHQYIQQMRPLADIIASGNFVFLQESELDSPDLNPATGFNANEGQNQGSTSVNSNATTSLTSQSNLPQQQHQPGQTQSQHQAQHTQQSQLSAISQSGGIPQKQQQQSQQAPSAPSISAAPIPTQTFTNQSFPPIVPPPTAMFQQGVQNPTEISSSQSQMPVFAGPLPIPLAPAAVVQQQPIVAPITTPSIGNINVSQNSATVLKSVETQQQQQQGIITSQQPPLITGPSGASVPLPGFTSVVSSKFPSAPTQPAGGTHQVTVQKTQETYEKLQKSSQDKNMTVLSEHQMHHHHKKVDDIKDRLNENSNDWDSSENLSKPQRMSKKENESNQWSNEVVTNNVKTNEWNNSSYDNQAVVVETNNWNSNNQNDGGGGGSYGARTRTNFGNRSGGSGGGSRGIRNSGSGVGNGGPGGPQSNGYRGGRSNSSYQQQQGSRTSGMYFRNNNDNTTGSGGGSSGGGGGGYYQNHQNNGYNSGGGTSKQDGGTAGGNNSYGGGTMNTGYRPRGGPLTSSNRQQQSGNGGGNRSTSNSGGGGPLPQRTMNSNRPPSNSGNNASGSGGGMSGNPNRSAVGTSGGGRTANSYRPTHVRQHQQQQQQDVNV